MKQITIILLIASISLRIQAQSTDSSKNVFMMTDMELGMQYLKKSKGFKVGGWTLLISGVALSFVGSSVSVNSLYDGSDSYKTGNALMSIGTLMSAVSIPLFIAGARNKGRAEILLRKSNIPLGHLPQQAIPIRSAGVGFRIGK